MESVEQAGTSSLLIVEDSRIQAKILKDKLGSAGYEVRAAENGRIGLEMIKEQRPTLVISDIEMPTMTGYELCTAVKSDPELRTIPFILLSTLADAQDIIKGLHCGADNYVTKPYDPDYLISRIGSLLETPIAQDDDEEELEVTLDGNRYSVKAGRQQVLNLLISTFENAVNKNHELIRMNEELTVAKDQLARWNEELGTLNSQLESANDRMSHDLQAAARIQQSLLPTSNPETDRVRLAWTYLPCDELAGDFLNFFALDETHIGVYVVDVSGHGVASSLLSVTIGRVLTPHATSSSLLVHPRQDGSGMDINPPSQVAYELNRRFQMADQGDLYFTMTYGVLDLETLEFDFVAAGHEPLVHVSAQQTPKLINDGDMAIGWVEGIEYSDYRVQLSPGDRLYLYSDGVPEAMDADLNQFSMQRMLEIIELGQSQSLDDSVRTLSNAVERWCTVKGPRDDVSIVGLEIVAEN